MKLAARWVTRHKVMVLIVLIIVTVGCGHQTQYGLVPAQSADISLQQLQNSWTDYFIYYNTRIVVFDPITDAYTLQVGDRWVLIEDSNELTAIFSRLELSPRFDLDEIYQIMDPRGIIYGYLIYASGDLVSLKRINENTLRIYYSPQRPPDAP